MKGVSMGKWILLDLQVSPIRKCKEFKIWLCQSAAPKFLMFGFMGLPWRGSWTNKTLLWRHPRGSGSLYSLAGVLGTLQPGETLPAAGEWRAFPPQSECLFIHFFIISQLHISFWSTQRREAVCRQERCWQSHATSGTAAVSLPFSGCLENYLPVGWFPSTCFAPLWIFMLLY